MARIPSEFEAQIRERIRIEFGKNKHIKGVLDKIKKGSATYADADFFCAELGGITSKALTGATFTVAEREAAEDIAENILMNLLRQNYKVSASVCSAIQEALNEYSGTGIAPIVPEFMTGRAEGIVTAFENAEAAKAVETISESIVNFTIACADSFAKKNVDFLSEAGLSPYVVRTYEGPHFDPHRGRPAGAYVDCPYCKSRAGKFEKGDVGYNQAFQRHDGCRCSVDVYPSKKAASGIANAIKRGVENRRDITKDAEAILSERWS